MVMAMEDVTATSDAELSVRRGELLYVLTMHPDGWGEVSRRADGESEGKVPLQACSPPHGVMLADFTAEDEGEVNARASQRIWTLDPTPSNAVGWSQVRGWHAGWHGCGDAGTSLAQL